MSFGTDEFDQPGSGGYYQSLAAKYAPPEPEPEPVPAPPSPQIWLDPGGDAGMTGAMGGFAPPSPAYEPPPYVPPAYTPAYTPPSYSAPDWGSDSGASGGFGGFTDYTPPPAYQQPVYTPLVYDDFVDYGSGYDAPPTPDYTFDPGRERGVGYDEMPPLPVEPAYDPYQGGDSADAGYGALWQLTDNPVASLSEAPLQPENVWTLQPDDPGNNLLAYIAQHEGNDPEATPDWGAAPGLIAGGLAGTFGPAAGAIAGGFNAFNDAFGTAANFGREGMPSFPQQLQNAPTLALLNLGSPTGIMDALGPGLAVRGVPGYVASAAEGFRQAADARNADDPGGIVAVLQQLGAGNEHAKKVGEELERNQPQDFPGQHTLQNIGAQLIPDVALNLGSAGAASAGTAAKAGRYAKDSNTALDILRSLYNPMGMAGHDAQQALGGLYAGQIAGTMADKTQDETNAISAVTAALPKAAPAIKNLPVVNEVFQTARSTRLLEGERLYQDAMDEAMRSGLLSDPTLIEHILTTVPRADQPQAFQNAMATLRGAGSPASGLSAEVAELLPSYLPEYMNQLAKLGDEREAMKAARGIQSAIIRQTDEFHHPLNPVEAGLRWAGEKPGLKQVGQAANDVANAWKQGVLWSGRFFGQNTVDAAGKNALQGAGVDLPGSTSRLTDFTTDYGMHPPSAVTDSVNREIGQSGSQLLSGIPKVGDFVEKYVNPVLSLPSQWNSNIEQAVRLPLFEKHFNDTTAAALPDLIAGVEKVADAAGVSAYDKIILANQVANTGGRISGDALQGMLEKVGVQPGFAPATQLANEWQGLLRTAAKMGQQAVEDTHYDYGKRTVADTALGTALPFTMWGTRTPGYVTEQLGKYPEIGTDVLNYQHEAQRQQDEKGLPNSYANRVDTGIDVAGGSLYSDPGVVHPLGSQIHTLYKPQNAPTLDQITGQQIPGIGGAKPGEILAEASRFGANPYPWMTAIPQEMGWLGERPAGTTGTFPLQRLAYGLTADQRFTPEAWLRDQMDKITGKGTQPSPLTPDKGLNFQWSQAIAELALAKTGKPIDQSPELLAQSQDPNSPLAQEAYAKLREKMGFEAVNSFFNPAGGKILTPEAETIYAAKKQARQQDGFPPVEDASRAYVGDDDSPQAHALRLAKSQHDAATTQQERDAIRAANPELDNYLAVQQNRPSITQWMEQNGKPGVTADRVDESGKLIGPGNDVTFAAKMQAADAAERAQNQAAGNGQWTKKQRDDAVYNSGIEPKVLEEIANAKKRVASHEGMPLPGGFDPNSQPPEEPTARREWLQKARDWAYATMNYAGEKGGQYPYAVDGGGQVELPGGWARTLAEQKVENEYRTLAAKYAKMEGMRPPEGFTLTPKLPDDPDARARAVKVLADQLQGYKDDYNSRFSQYMFAKPPGAPNAPPPGHSPASGGGTWQDNPTEKYLANEAMRVAGAIRGYANMPLPPGFNPAATPPDDPAERGQWLKQQADAIKNAWDYYYDQKDNYLRAKSGGAAGSGGGGNGRYSGGGYSRSAYGGGYVRPDYESQRNDRLVTEWRRQAEGINQQLRVAGLPPVPDIQEFAAEGLSGDDLLNRAHLALNEAKDKIHAVPLQNQFKSRVQQTNAKLKAAGQPELDADAMLAAAAEANGLTDPKAIVDAAHQALNAQQAQFAEQGVKGFAPGTGGGYGGGASNQAGWDTLHQRQQADSDARLAKANADYDARQQAIAEQQHQRAVEQSQRDLQASANRNTAQMLSEQRQADYEKRQLQQAQEQTAQQQARAARAAQQQAAIDALYEQRDALRFGSQLQQAQQALARAQGGSTPASILSAAVGHYGPSFASREPTAPLPQGKDIYAGPVGRGDWKNTYRKPGPPPRASPADLYAMRGSPAIASLWAALNRGR